MHYEYIRNENFKVHEYMCMRTRIFEIVQKLDVANRKSK